MEVRSFVPGLYTVRFSYMALDEAADGALEAAGGQKVAPNSASRGDSQAGEPLATPALLMRQKRWEKWHATEFSGFHFLARLRIINEFGFLSGKIKVLTPSSSLSLHPFVVAARGDHSNAASHAPSAARDAGAAEEPTTADAAKGSSSDDAACLVASTPFEVVNDCNATLLPSSVFLENAESILLAFGVDRLDGEIVGLQRELQNVTLTCSGTHTLGWYVGEVKVAEGDTMVQLPRRMRFVCRPSTEPRCTMCHDPVYASGYTCVCGAVEYCTRACQQEHQQGHAVLCQALRTYYTIRNGDTCAEVNGTEFTVWWRSLDNARYLILVDHTSPLGIAYELLISTLSDARTGTQVRFLYPPSKRQEPEMRSEEMSTVNCGVFKAVASAAMKVSCHSLAAACLNHLYVYSDKILEVQSPHLQYYNTCCEEQFEGNGHVYSIEEYISYARPLHELVMIMIESALTSSMGYDFWKRMKLAKNVLINLYNFNTITQFPAVPDLADVVVQQQRQTLLLLAKTFIIMAARAPKDAAQKLLTRAEECYKDSIQEDNSHKDEYHEGLSCYHLAALYLLFDDPAKSEEAAELREKGKRLIEASKQSSQVAKPEAMPNKAS